MSKYNKPYYNSWRCMLSRCYRKNDPSYNHYGGRGIKVCDEWHDFYTFEKWVLTSNYEQGLTIDRINCDEDYSPANCQWSDKKTQANNKTNTYHITHNGETHTVSEWAEITGINRKTLSGRVWRGIKPPELFEPSVFVHKGMRWIVGKDGKRKWVSGT